MITQPNPSGYAGEIAVIPLGKSGLFTDAPQCDIPMTGLIRANNATYYNQVLQKDYGSRIWNSTACPEGIVRGIEMYPDSQSQDQRLYALCKDGQIYKFPNYYTRQTISPATGAPVSLRHNNYNCMVVGGNELLNRNKKLFTLNGYDTPQVISGDGTTRSNISKPAADWTGTAQPFGGVIHRGALYAWGNRNNPHGIYSSNVLDHEDFQTVAAAYSYTVYPGEYDGVVGGCVFRGRLFMFKYPLGVYYLVDTDSDRGNWYFAKQSDDFGACSPQSATVAMNDLFIANNYGSITSMQAALVFGDTLASDLFHAQGCYRFAHNEVRSDIITTRSMVYYAKKQQLLTAFQSNGGSQPDRIAIVDFKNPQKVPKIAWVTKDQPNCLFLVRDAQKVPKPFYGAEDGYLYEMDVSDHWVGSATDTTLQTAYTFDAQTPHFDLSQMNLAIGTQVKTFEFLEVQYEPTGDWDVTVDVYIDARYQGSYPCNLSGRSNLSEMPLNSSLVDGLSTFSRKFQIYGDGRTISLRFRNAVLGQDVRLVRAFVYYRISGQQESVG